MAVAVDLLFVILSIRYGNLLEVEAVLAGAEILVVVAAVAGIYAAIVFRAGA